MREITSGEVYKLEECLAELAEHHNKVSVQFSGSFPKKPISETLVSFGKDIESGRSRIFAVADGERVKGFCKIDINGTEGKIDYLVVLKEYRGKGYGNMLMERAKEVFAQSGVGTVEVRVVDGNDAVAFYEKHGFRTISHIMRSVKALPKE